MVYSFFFFFWKGIESIKGKQFDVKDTIKTQTKEEENHTQLNKVDSKKKSQHESLESKLQV